VCGIAGVYGKLEDTDAHLVSAMTSTLFHRGPMDQGYLSGHNIALGMRRLSIIDVEGGQQPIYNEDGTIGVMCNGEVYNYLELRQDLLAKGHEFTTNSDTEVIVHLYEEMGEEFPKALNGMFAIAVWDSRKCRLILARDRLGEKPLYYYDNGQRLAFASELKALLQCPFVPREPDPQAIAEYLSLMYIRAPRTAFSRISKLPPAHYLRADVSGVCLVPYWDLREHCEPSSLNEGETVEKVRWLLRDSVRLRLRSDVPVAAFLSGGIDSSSVVAFAADSVSGPLQTFAVGFAGDGFDELGYAREVATAFGTEHQETTVTEDDAIRLLPQLVWHLDEPNGDSAIVPTYLISKFAAQEVRVILSGVGGDELFGGYPRYFDGYQIEQLYRTVPSFLRRNMVGPLTRSLPPTLANRIAWNSLPQDQRYWADVSIRWPRDIFDRLDGTDVSTTSYLGAFHEYPGKDRFNRLMYLDTVTYLPDNILHITDRMSMAASLEARAPFLDHRLVELCAGIPGRYKLSPVHRQWKIILKKAMAPYLPPRIISRPKWGFGAPVQAWMKRQLFSTVESAYRRSVAVESGLFDPASIRRVLDLEANRARPRRFYQQLWMLLILELWCRIYLDGGPKKVPTFTLDDLGK
jgi:asparagine synthase (glutamine-hydrolysing)